jgi:hypothetical protein
MELRQAQATMRPLQGSQLEYSGCRLQYLSRALGRNRVQELVVMRPLLTQEQVTEKVGKWPWRWQRQVVTSQVKVPLGLSTI